MSLGISVNEAKVGALVAYLSFLMPDIQLRKLLKLVYLIDEESVRQRAIPVTWLDYYAWEKGPVAPEVYAVKDGAFSRYVSCEKKTDGKWHVNSVRAKDCLFRKDINEFSEWEKHLIDHVVEKYGSMDSDSLTEETHQTDSLWSQVVRENRIDFESCSKSDCEIDLNRLNVDDSAKMVFEEAQDAMYMQSLINSNSMQC